MPNTDGSTATCPFCGLLCDDVRIDADRLISTGPGPLCPRAAEGYAAALGHSTSVSARIEGKRASVEAAIERAASILAASEAPLIGGLQTDVNGVRAATRLAERLGAALDHSHSDALLRNVRIVQRDGWITSTLSEVRNRADLVVLVGSQLFERFPRLVERVVLPATGQHPERLARRRIVLVGPWDRATLPAAIAERATVIDVAAERLAEFFGALRALRAGRTLSATTFAGVARERIEPLVEVLGTADYAVIAWAAGDLGTNDAHAHLAIDAIVSLVRAENHTHRVVGLPLAGSGADITANQVLTWLTGYPLRTAFRDTVPEHDQVRHALRAHLHERRCDALVWISGFDPSVVPRGVLPPTIVIGHPALALANEPAVFLPSAIPGIDHSGHLYRTDSVVSLPLRRLRESATQPASALLDAITDRLRECRAC